MTPSAKVPVMTFHEYVCPVGHISHVMAAPGDPAPAVCVRCDDDFAGVAWEPESAATRVCIPVVSVGPAFEPVALIISGEVIASAA